MSGSTTRNNGASPVPPNNPEQQMILREWREGVVTNEPRCPVRNAAPPEVPAKTIRARDTMDRWF